MSTCARCSASTSSIRPGTCCSPRSRRVVVWRTRTNRTRRPSPCSGTACSTSTRRSARPARPATSRTSVRWGRSTRRSTCLTVRLGRLQRHRPEQGTRPHVLHPTQPRRLRGLTDEEVQHAATGMEQEAGAPVRAHQGRTAGRGESEDTAEEIAARTVNKERARYGEARVEPHLDEGHLVRPPRRPALTQGSRWSHVRPALQRGQGKEDQGPFQDEQGPAGARRRALTSSVAYRES